MHRFKSEYFWWHRIASELATSDQKIGRRIALFPSSDPAHCMTKEYWKTAPFFKRCAKKVFRTLVTKADICCGAALTNRPAFESEECSSWDCSSLASNWDRAEPNPIHSGKFFSHQ
jgi:hypothetical protein